MAASIAKSLPFSGTGARRATKLWSPAFARLGRQTWTLATPATVGWTREGFRQRNYQTRTNSTVVNRPAVYDSPPPLAPATPQASSVPAQLFPSQTSSEQPENGKHNDGESEANRHIFLDAVKATKPRNDWTTTEVASIYYQPLLELAHQAVSDKASPCVGAIAITPEGPLPLFFFHPFSLERFELVVSDHSGF